MRVLLAILEAGGGHRAAARAVAAALGEVAPDVQVEIEDVGAGVPIPIINDPPRAYRLFLDSPARPIFECAWRYFDRPTTARAIFKTLYPATRGHITDVLQRQQPDLVVGMHAGVAGVFARLRAERGERDRYRVLTAVTDIVSVHALWTAPECDGHLVPTEEARASVLRYGADPARTHVTGFPIHPDFVRLAPAVLAPPRPERPRVLLMGGGAGAGGVEPMLTGLERCRAPLDIEVVAGRNPDLQSRLAARRHAPHHAVNVHGFVTEMAALMARCDIVVTKAGPGSLMEAWSLRKPTLVGAAVGPQEVGNREWGERRHLARPAGGPDGVAAALTDLLDHWDSVHAAMQPIPTRGAYEIAERLSAHVL